LLASIDVTTFLEDFEHRVTLTGDVLTYPMIFTQDPTCNNSWLMFSRIFSMFTTAVDALVIVTGYFSRRTIFASLAW
jgi:hypothetical protein